MIERRYIAWDGEVRAKGEVTMIAGHAAVFNRLSQNLGGFVEQVAPGAFDKTLQEADIRALFNHDANFVLGRNKAGTLRLAPDNIGLGFEIDPPDTTVGRDLLVSLQRKDVTQSSFSFRVMDDEWGLTEQEFPLRTLKEVALYDVGPVTFPAYLDADSFARTALHSLAERSERSIDDVCALARTGELRSLISPEDDGAGRLHSVTSLETRRRRLALYERV